MHQCLSLGRSSDIVVNAEEFCNRILALELQDNQMEQWYDICPRNDGADVKSERQNPLDAMELGLDFKFTITEDVDAGGRFSVFGNASPVVALTFNLQNELPEGIVLLPEGGILDGAATQLGNNTRVQILVEVSDFPQSNRTQVVEFDIVDVAPVFENEVTVELFKGEIILNDYKTQGGEVTAWSILSGNDDLTNLGLIFAADEGLIRGTIPPGGGTAMITVQGSNSGGVSTYTLLLDIDPEEEIESTPWPEILSAIGIILAFIVILVQVMNKKEPPNLTVNIKAGPDPDLKEEFAQWALDQLSTPSSESSPPPHLQRWIDGLTRDDSFDFKIGFAPGYPHGWPNYHGRAKQATFDFMRALLVYGGTFTPNVGGYIEVSKINKDKWTLVEPSLAYLSRVPFMDFAEELPGINKAISSFCTNLYQHSVIVCIGPYKAKFCNPNGDKEMEKIAKELEKSLERGEKLQTPLPHEEILSEFLKLDPKFKDSVQYD